MKGFSFITAALLLAATPAAAQDRLWGHSGPWEVRQGDVSCTARHRARDAAETELVIEQSYGRGLQLKASGKGWQQGSAPLLGFFIEGDSVVIEADGPAAAVSQAPGRNGFQLNIAPASVYRVFTSRRISVYMPDNAGDVPVIQMPPSTMVERDLAACVAELGDRENGSGKPAVTPPLSRGAIGGWTTIDDYPAAARRAQIGGHLRIRLQVDAYTRVTGCDVIESTGNAQLDGNYCAIYKRRARFSTPPRDAHGRPTRGSFDIVMELVPSPMPYRPVPEPPMP